MTEQNLKDKYRGCIIGQAVGDALGFIVEGNSPKKCKEYIEELLAEENFSLFKRGSHSLGQYSDDTQLARELMLSIVDCKEFNAEDYAKRIAAMFGENKIVGWGLATREAANRLLAGVPWQESGDPYPSAGNGSAMRAAPLGLFFYDNPEKMIQVASEQSIITHSDPRCCAGSVAIAGAVALALQSDSIEIKKYLDQLTAWTSDIDTTISKGIQELEGWLGLSPEEAADYIANYGYQSGFVNDWPGISPYVVSSVLWSLYAFLKTPDDFLESIKVSIAVGGDVDTTGAMTGAVSGAYNGLNNIPRNITMLLNDKGKWRSDELSKLAQNLYDLAKTS